MNNEDCRRLRTNKTRKKKNAFEGNRKHNKTMNIYEFIGQMNRIVHDESY